jgi:hypothetical protein
MEAHGGVRLPDRGMRDPLHSLAESTGSEKTTEVTSQHVRVSAFESAEYTWIEFACRYR